MRAHFFDIDTLLVSDAKVWIVDKKSPNIPIMKISQSEFNLIKNGIYRNQNNSLNFSGVTYWLPEDLVNTLKIKAKNYRSDFSSLGFSMQEFMNKELIENIDYSINFENIMHLKNTDDDIYFICSKNTKRNYELMISKIEDKLRDNGLNIKSYYFISETFYNRNNDSISHKKVRLLLQHLIGYKTDGDKFVDEKITKYDEVFFYDDEDSVIKLASDVNKFLMTLLSNTDSSIKDIIKKEIKEKEHILYVNKVTFNKVNKFVTTKVLLETGNLIKTFENFKFK
jgi:hypothetical protein